MTTRTEYDNPPPTYSATIPQRHLRLDAPRPHLPPQSQATPERRARASPKPTLPSTKDCLAHLKLLECFHGLRERIGRTDGLFGIFDSFVSQTAQNGPEREAAQARLCEKRWQIYVTRASVRFQAWWKTLDPDARMLDERQMRESDYGGIVLESEQIYFGVENLPPLDVLMVYHAFLLNPRNFLADCIRHGNMSLWATGMPWQAVASVIRKTGNGYAYEPNDHSHLCFKTLTKHPWDNLEEPPVLAIKCPRCTGPLEAPWTTVDDAAEWRSSTPGENGRGFADKGLGIRCPAKCGLTINHEILRTQRFKNDMRALFVGHVPMPGTFLTLAGLPQSSSEQCPGKGAFRATFPNRLLKAGLGKKIATLCSARKEPPASVNDILKAIKEGIEDQELLRIAAMSKVKTHREVFVEERAAIRRMMSCYWDNSSIFHLDLVGAVIRQNSFTSKMHDIGWLHSPAAVPTMQRLIERYENYFAIMARYPGQVVVPCLDIDLAWHTHQTTPSFYFAYSREKTGVLIDHDDKIGENKLSTSFEWTSKTYQEMFKQPYSECTCWFCAALRASIDDVSSHPIDHLSVSPPPSSNLSSSTSNNKLRRLFKSSSSTAETKAGPPAPRENQTQQFHPSTHSTISTPAALLENDPDALLAALLRSKRLASAFAAVAAEGRKRSRGIENNSSLARDAGSYNADMSWGLKAAGDEDLQEDIEKNTDEYDDSEYTDPYSLQEAHMPILIQLLGPAKACGRWRSAGLYVTDPGCSSGTSTTSSVSGSCMSIAPSLAEGMAAASKMRGQAGRAGRGAGGAGKIQMLNKGIELLGTGISVASGNCIGIGGGGGGGGGCGGGGGGGCGGGGS